MKLTKTYSAKEIHAAIVAKNIAMITEMIGLQKKDRVSPPAVVSSEYDRLCRLGLANTKNAQILKTKIDEVGVINEGIDSYNAAIDKQKEFCQFVKEMLEVFGHNTLLVRFDDFEQIIKKYNLTCGCLEDYTGVIPEKNLKELEEAKRKLNIAKGYDITSREFYTVSIFTPYDDLRFKKLHHPSLYKNICDLRRVTEIDTDYADSATIKKLKVFPFISTNEQSDSDIVADLFKQRETGIKLSREKTNLFIVAPYKDMKNGIKFRHFVKAEDPFICSYTPFGIMIHTAWGEEAEDEVLSKYYAQLNLLED